MAAYGSAYQLETTTDTYLLEDGSGVYLLEINPLTFWNYLFVKVGDGMGCAEKIR